jgi:hypothetical protein
MNRLKAEVDALRSIGAYDRLARTERGRLSRGLCLPLFSLEPEGIAGEWVASTGSVVRYGGFRGYSRCICRGNLYLVVSSPLRYEVLCFDSEGREGVLVCSGPSNFVHLKRYVSYSKAESFWFRSVRGT